MTQHEDAYRKYLSDDPSNGGSAEITLVGAEPVTHIAPVDDERILILEGVAASLDYMQCRPTEDRLKETKACAAAVRSVACSMRYKSGPMN